MLGIIVYRLLARLASYIALVARCVGEGYTGKTVWNETVSLQA